MCAGLSAEPAASTHAFVGPGTAVRAPGRLRSPRPVEWPPLRSPHGARREPPIEVHSSSDERFPRNIVRRRTTGRVMTSPIRARERCPSDTASCLDIESADQRLTRDPRATTGPTLPAHYGAGASVIAAQARASARPPLTEAECGRMTDAMLDQQATVLRSRIGRAAFLCRTRARCGRLGDHRGRASDA